jgi:hypothetical protein
VCAAHERCFSLVGRLGALIAAFHSRVPARVQSTLNVSEHETKVLINAVHQSTIGLAAGEVFICGSALRRKT